MEKERGMGLLFHSKQVAMGVFDKDKDDSSGAAASQLAFVEVMLFPPRRSDNKPEMVR